MARPESVPELTEALREVGYLADRGLATTLHVALQLGRPVLLEGEVGVGKTEVARALSELLDRRLIRLQCYEGIDAQQALYEWDYARQMLQIRALSEHQLTDDDSVDALFGPKFLVERPLLDAVRTGDRAVLLIDEVDRADDEFEAFLLELLSEFQITIPEIGPIRAEQPPLVILTSNRTRELHDALKRRCLYHWVGFPSPEREVEIVLVRAPGVSEAAGARSGHRGQPAARAWTSPSRRASPRPSTGSTPWVCSARRASTTRPCPTPWVPSSRTATTSSSSPVTSTGSSQVPDEPRAESGDQYVAMLADFAGTLRDDGVPVGSGDVLTYTQAVATLDPTDLMDLYWAGRTTLVGRRDHVPIYHRAFARYFLDDAADTPASQRFTPDQRIEARAALAVPETEVQGEEREQHAAKLGLAASGARTMRRKDFGACTPEELAVLRRILRTMRLTPPRRRSRRTRPARTGRSLDVRRTVRETLRLHGEPAQLLRRERRLRHRPLTLILDVSGSMADYSRHLVQFAHTSTRTSSRGGGLLLRHPADPDHPRARPAPPRRGPRPGGRGGPRLGRRHPDRRRRSTGSSATTPGTGCAAAASW